MFVKKHDFRGGIGFIKHIFVIILQNLLLWAVKGNKFRFYTEGSSYIDKQIRADGLFENGAIEILNHICVNPIKIVYLLTSVQTLETIRSG